MVHRVPPPLLLPPQKNISPPTHVLSSIKVGLQYKSEKCGNIKFSFISNAAVAETDVVFENCGELGV